MVSRCYQAGLLMFVVWTVGCATQADSTGSCGNFGFNEDVVEGPGRGSDLGPVGPDLVMHSCCSQPLPAVMPSVPMVDRTGDGRPVFDVWRDLACPVEAWTCDIGDPATCLPRNCLRVTEEGEGVCVYGDIDIDCDQEGEVVGYRDGQCWACMPAAVHKAACCEGIDGIDCRAWPFPADGRPGMVCARHEDCETGLICGASRGKGYGICQCPETIGREPVPGSPSCFEVY